MDGEIDRWTYREKTDILIDGQSERRTDVLTNGQTDRKMERQTDSWKY
jgi:hypothetical protein